MNDLIVHLGYPKCASTYLQKEVFPCLSDAYLDGLKTSVLCGPNFSKSSFMENIDLQLLNNDVGHLSIISCPTISSPAIERYNQHYFETVLLNLTELNKNVKVLVILRNQISLIKSWYVYSVTRGLNSITFNSFNKWLEKDFSVLDPGLMLTCCEKYIGSKRMLVLPMELLSIDSSCFMEFIFDFVGRSIKINSNEKLNSGYYNKNTVLLWRFGNFVYLLSEKFARTIGINTKRGGFWHSRVKNGFQRTKKRLNPKIDQLMPNDFSLEIPESKKNLFKKRFSTGNRIAHSFSAYPLDKLNYPL